MILILILNLLISPLFAEDEFPTIAYSPDTILNTAFLSTRNYLKNIYEQNPTTYDPKRNELTIWQQQQSSCGYYLKIEILRKSTESSIEENLRLLTCRGTDSFIYLYREGYGLSPTPDEDLFLLKFPPVNSTKKYVLSIPLIKFRMDYSKGSAVFYSKQKTWETTVFFSEGSYQCRFGCGQGSLVSSQVKSKPTEYFRSWRFDFSYNNGSIQSPQYLIQSLKTAKSRNLIYTINSSKMSSLEFDDKFKSSVLGLLTQYYLPSALNDFMGLPPLQENITIYISF